MDARDLEKALRKENVSEEIIGRILSADYIKSEDPKQDDANYHFVAMKLCDELLDADVLQNVMLNRACCKTGERLQNSRRVAAENKGKPLSEKLLALGQQKFMGHPELTEDGDIYTNGCAGTWQDGKFICSCWRLNGRVPSDGDMPLSYCLCCGGHFRHHYQKALGVKLRIKKVVSSALHDPSKPCSFLFEIIK